MARNDRQAKFLLKIRRLALAVCLFAYVPLWLGGVFSHLFFGGVRENQNWLGSLFLFLAGAIIFISARSKKEILMLVGFAFFGFVAEAIGVRFGFPFGAYEYTNALGFRLFDVPVVIALAWMTLICFVREMILPLRLSRLKAAALAGLWVTAIDLLIDPLAVNLLGYWRWENAGIFYNIPLTNFAGWFLTTFAAFYLLHQKSKPNRWRLHLGFSVILFFTLLALAHQIFPVALIGASLCLPYLIFIYNSTSWYES